jgi:hypothetical protein
MERRLVFLLSFLIAFSSAALAQTSGGIRHRAVRSGVPTSDALIDAALTGGKIDAETALQYRVFAAFGDCRLPVEFRGDDSKVMSTSILQEVAARFPTLSAAAQSTLLPFLREPYEPDGWVAAQQSACGSGKLAAAADILTKTIVILGGKVGVTYSIYDPAGQATAQQLATAIETTIYPKLTALMGEPLLYPSPPFDGVRRWNLSLVSRSFIFPAKTGELQPVPLVKCKHGPAFSEIEIRHDFLKSSVAHELMRAIQIGYDLPTTCFSPEYDWISHATATWAMDFVYPNPIEIDGQHEGDVEHFWADALLEFPGSRLDNVKNGAYLLPFYIHRRFGDAAFVRRIWESAQTKLSLDAVDDALASHGGFSEQWPEFARFNWNRAPYDDYSIWDRLHTAARPEGDFLLSIQLDHRFEMLNETFLAELFPLSAKYYHFDVLPSAESIAFLNGFTFKLGIRQWATQPELGNLFVLDNASDPRSGGKIQALVKINGTWEKTARDWTHLPYVEFCREVPEERLEELVIIYSNSEYKNNKPIEREGLPPMLWASNMSCSGWKTVQATLEASDREFFFPLTMKWTAKFTRVVNAPQPMQTLPAEGLPLLGILYNGSGLIEWSVNGSRRGCTYSGGATFPIQYAQLATWNFAPPEGTMHRLYFGAMLTQQIAHFSENCGAGPVDESAPLPPWGILPPPTDKAEVTPSGCGFKEPGQFSLQYLGKWIWTFVTDPP